jgi:hypothetical protein
VGDKTFVLHDGVWTDTEFDPDKMAPQPVSFGSDDYFALVVARPELGRYFALGDHVVVVLEGTAYEVREGDAPPVQVPGGTTPGPEPTSTAAPTPEAPQDLLEAILRAVSEWIVSFIERFQR